MSESRSSKPGFLDVVKTFSNIIIWLIGIVFVAGSIYTKVIQNEKDFESQDKSLKNVEKSQTKIIESISRIEDQSIKSSTQIMSEVSKINEKFDDMNEKVLRNQYDIDQIKKDIQTIKEK